MSEKVIVSLETYIGFESLCFNYYDNDGFPVELLEDFVAEARVNWTKLVNASGKDWELKVQYCDHSLSAVAVRERSPEELQKIEDKKKELEEAEKRVNQLKSELAHYKE